MNIDYIEKDAIEFIKSIVNNEEDSSISLKIYDNRIGLYYDGFFGISFFNSLVNIHDLLTDKDIEKFVSDVVDML